MWTTDTIWMIVRLFRFTWGFKTNNCFIDNFLNIIYSLYCTKKLKEGRSGYKILRHTPNEKIPLGRPRRRWEDNIRMVLKE